MKNEKKCSTEEKRSGLQEHSFRWCPVCRKDVRVKISDPVTALGMFRDQMPVHGEGNEAALGTHFIPVCSNCDVCLLKAAGAGQGGNPGKG
jgi:hypothetical protein